MRPTLRPCIDTVQLRNANLEGPAYLDGQLSLVGTPDAQSYPSNSVDSRINRKIDCHADTSSPHDISADQVCYRYDGSLDGLLCCIFEAYAHKEHPLSIVSGDAVQLALDAQVRDIATDPVHASRVQQGIFARIGPEAFACVQTAALSADPRAAAITLAYVRLGFSMGPRIDQHLSDPAVHAMNKLLRQVDWEARRYIQFLRFAELEGGIFFAEMEPEHDVLLLVMPHFADRFGQQPFIIHDKTRALAGVWDMREWAIVSSETMHLPSQTQGEAAYQALWRMFYNTIAIKQRINPKLRQQFMPKKFWRYMVEMQPLLPTAAASPRLHAINVKGPKPLSAPLDEAQLTEHEEQNAQCCQEKESGNRAE